MNFTETDGIVLHRTKYADNSLIVKIYTKTAGTQSFIIKNAFSKKSKLSYPLFAPLTILNLTFNFRKNQQLLFIKEAHRLHQWQNIPFDVVKNCLSVFYNEVMYKLLYYYGEDEILFNFLLESLLELDSPNTINSDIHLFFLLNLSKFVGISPENNYSKTNCIFSLENGRFVNPNEISVYFLKEDVSHLLNQYLLVLHTKTHITALSVLKKELLLGLIQYFNIHNHNICKESSLDILTQLLH
ncbi:MAG: DNA repair protein RecO [Bacteroidales bacterium]|jgi:DNA repair protein RecO (recombination protein O)|nr:DNA repair protein RecO [Bacteroidales bacterium]